MGHVFIPVQKLVDRIGDPFQNTYWTSKHDPVTREMVRDSVLHGTYDRAHWSFSNCPAPVTNFQFDGEWHAQRIAYLHMFGWDRPIEIDVGIPSLNYWPYPLLDGHHRLCAAVYAGATHIEASVSGALDYAFELFGVDCTNYDLSECA